jgi:hypothetical protein
LTISGVDGKETISLLPEGTAIVSAHAGTTTTSSISGAYDVLPTNAPILTLGGRTFTAINNGATYVIDGQTLTPGGTNTVTINGHVYLVSLSPHATLLEVEVLGLNGKVVSTMFETLFPASGPSITIYNTEAVRSSTATQRATPSDGASPTGTPDHERPKKGTSSSSRPLIGGMLGMLSLSALTLLM